MSRNVSAGFQRGEVPTSALGPHNGDGAGRLDAEREIVPRPRDGEEARRQAAPLQREVLVRSDSESCREA